MLLRLMLLIPAPISQGKELKCFPGQKAWQGRASVCGWEWTLGSLGQGQRLGVTDKVTLAIVCLPRVCLMGNVHKSLCESLLAICSFASLLGRLGLFNHQA